MKRSLLTAGLFAVTLILPAAFVHAGDESKTPTASTIPTARPTHQTVQKKLSKQQKEANADTQSSAKPVKKTSTENRAFNIADESTLLASKGLLINVTSWTVIYTPSHLKSKIVSKPTGKISDWKQFFLKNKGWIHLHPVTMAQARGESVLKPDVIKAYQSMGKMVVATYQNNPISVIAEALVIPKK